VGFDHARHSGLFKLIYTPNAKWDLPPIAALLLHNTEAKFMNVQFHLRFFEMILRVLRLEVSVRISLTTGRGYGFLSDFPPFSLKRTVNEL
jgi:hypothetical protein